jgi:hypothetical protein
MGLIALLDPSSISPSNIAVGGVVFRRTRCEVIDAQIERDIWIRSGSRAYYPRTPNPNKRASSLSRKINER